jgi:hypothetical protein
MRGFDAAIAAPAASREPAQWSNAQIDDPMLISTMSKSILKSFDHPFIDDRHSQETSISRPMKRP